MEVRVDEVEGLPPHTYISVRYGEQRRQAPFAKGEVLAFPGASEGKAYTVDVFRKVGSKQVSLAGITALGGVVASEGLAIPSLEIQGSPITASLTARLTTQPPEAEESKRLQVARKAKGYMEKHGIQSVLHDMFAKLLEVQPGEPLAFMVDFLEHQREEAEERVAAEARNFALEPGLGASPLPGFADGTAGPAPPLPDLARHHSMVADVLRADPGLYTRLQGERTSLGVSLAECIKPGVDCPGHSLVKVAGAFAGDAECYEKFEPVLGPVVRALHPEWQPALGHPLEDNPAKLSNSRIDPTSRYAVHATMELRRNFRNVRLPTCCSKAERREVERLVNAALGAGGLRGAYLPLRHSESWPGRAGGMSPLQEQRLRGAGMLFADPDSRMRLAAGLGRDWPDARGVLLCEAEGLFMWCNEEDHLRCFARQHTVVDLKKLWVSLGRALRTVQQAAEAEGSGFASSERLGYLTACPSRLGAALRAVVSLKIPHLAAAADLPGLCRTFDLQVSKESGTAAHGDVWNVASSDPLGISEVDLINGLMEGCRRLVSLEQRLEKGEPIYDAMPGLGSEPAPGFPHRSCPAQLPDLVQHRSAASRVLLERPELYQRLRGARTPGGLGLAVCLKPCVDDRGQAGATTAGIVAAEADCYSTFADLFRPVLKAVHDFEPSMPQPHDGTAAKLSNRTIDQFGFHVLNVTVDLRRNLKGHRFGPSLTTDGRREVERTLSRAFALEGVLDGRYAPLAFSKSYAPMEGGMSATEQDRLLGLGLAFGEPRDTALLAAGLGRDWPDARGAFVAHAEDFSIWVNEEDHVRLRLKKDGSNVKEAFSCAFAVLQALEGALSKDGTEFAHDNLLGYLTVDPANVGCALRCAVSVRLPNLGNHPQLPALAQALHLAVARPGGGLELSTGSTLGASEVDAVNELIEGCAALVGVESAAAGGEDLDACVRALLERLGR